MPDLDLSLNFETVNAEISIPGIAGPRGPEGIVRTGELDSRYYSVNNPSGFITGVDLSQVVYTTGNQTIFGNKTFATGAIYLGTSIITAKDGNNSAGVDEESNPIYTLGGQGGSINLNGADGGEYSNGSNGGSINTSSNGPSDGGSINTSSLAHAHGGSINTYGGPQGIGGQIDTSNNGGSIITSAGRDNAGFLAGGGSINTSAGGGSIDTRGQGKIQFGNDTQRTTLSGTASTNITIYLPNESGTLLTNSSNVVYATGNQTISGAKTFADNIQVSGTGTFNALDLNNIDNLSLSGVDVTLTDSTINVNRNIFISGNPVLTELNLTPYATSANLASTGNNLSFLKEDHVIETRSFHLQPFVTNYLSGGRNVYTSFTYNGALPSYEVRLPTTNTQTGDKLYLSLTTPSTSAVSVYISQPGAASLYTTVPVNTTLTQTFYVSAINFIGGTFPTWTPMKNIMGYLDFTDLGDINTKINSLTGQNTFVNTFSHDEMNMNNNTFYFSNLEGLDASPTSSQRRSTFMRKCKAKYAAWSTYTVNAKENDSTSIFSTGYFINNTTSMTGTISTQIRHTVNSTLAVFTGEITPNIDINFGDQVQIALKVPNYGTGMSGVHNAVDVTFFY